MAPKTTRPVGRDHRGAEELGSPRKLKQSLSGPQSPQGVRQTSIHRHGTVLAEVDSDVGHYVAHGNDGSQVLQLFHAHFTVNANGDVTTGFFVNPTDC